MDRACEAPGTGGAAAGGPGEDPERRWGAVGKSNPHTP